MASSERITVGDGVVIYPRGKKRTWTAEFTHNGQHSRRSLKTSNKKIAVQRASVLAADLVTGTFETAPPSRSISDSIEMYLDHLETEQRRPGTIKTYRSALKAFKAFCDARRVGRLHQVSAVIMDGYRKELSTGHTERTVFNQSVVVKMFVAWCRSRRLIAADPLADYELKMPMPRRKPVPTLDEVRLVLDACKQPLLPRLAVLAFTGVRSGELRQLRNEDVDLETGWINIVSREETPTKTGASRRIPVHSDLAELLQCVPATPGPWFFTAGASTRYPDGGHWINPKRLNESFQRVCRRVGLPTGSESGFTVHSFRRFFKSHTINVGVPKPVVDRWVGHGSRRDLDAIYYELNDEESRKWMAHVSFENPNNVGAIE